MAKIKLPHAGYKFQHAAKFICTATIPGTSQQSHFPPGSYQTSVNIHNPHERSIKLRMKIAQPGLISKWISRKLKGDEVIRITCRDIGKFDIITIHGFEGFLVIESSHSIDVTAVYTASAKNTYVVSLDVEQIKERKLNLKK